MELELLILPLRTDFPLVEGIVKNTLFEQFCGGETREQSMKVVQKMYTHHIGSIFDYAIEGKEEEEAFDVTCKEIKENINFAVGNPAIPFCGF